MSQTKGHTSEKNPSAYRNRGYKSNKIMYWYTTDVPR